MARNAKLDLAKRQAVGVYRAVPRFSVKSVGDIRPTEGSKPCYQNRSHPSTSELIAAYTGEVTQCEGGVVMTREGRNMVRGECYLHAKGSRATPQSREHMNTFAFKARSRFAEPKWVKAGTQTLMPRG